MMMFGMGQACRYVEYNWYATSEIGEDFCSATVGKDHVESINYHTPQGEGDRHFCDIQMDSGVQLRIFNINKVEFL